MKTGVGGVAMEVLVGVGVEAVGDEEREKEESRRLFKYMALRKKKEEEARKKVKLVRVV
jgi:hypothetical protein